MIHWSILQAAHRFGLPWRLHLQLHNPGKIFWSLTYVRGRSQIAWSIFAFFFFKNSVDRLLSNEIQKLCVLKFVVVFFKNSIELTPPFKWDLELEMVCLEICRLLHLRQLCWRLSNEIRKVSTFLTLPSEEFILLFRTYFCHFFVAWLCGCLLLKIRKWNGETGWSSLSWTVQLEPKFGEIRVSWGKRI